MGEVVEWAERGPKAWSYTIWIWGMAT